MSKKKKKILSKEYWKDITFQCYRKYEKLVDLLAIKNDKDKKIH